MATMYFQTSFEALKPLTCKAGLLQEGIDARRYDRHSGIPIDNMSIDEAIVGIFDLVDAYGV